MRPFLFCFVLFSCCLPFPFVPFFFCFCFARPKTTGLVFLSLTYMTHSSLKLDVVTVLLLLRYRGTTRILHQNLLPNRFNFGGMREGISETDRIHRQTFNVGAELLAYSALHPTSTLLHKLKLAVIYLRISKLDRNWLIRCFWNKTKDKETALLAVNGVLSLARRW